MAEKQRLDAAVFEAGYAESREKAKALIMAGLVYVNNQKSDKPGTTVKPDDVIEFRGSSPKYVSRGGLKLEKAVENFGFSLKDKMCADIGASTGGFTDCMLQNGAVKVYAIDVGYGQLAWKLRTDKRVVNLERTNFRYVTEEQITDKLDFCSVDVSFISLSLASIPARITPSATAIVITVSSVNLHPFSNSVKSFDLFPLSNSYGLPIISPKIAPNMLTPPYFLAL